jgi:hypothetical protein
MITVIERMICVGRRMFNVGERMIVSRRMIYLGATIGVS